MLDLKKLSLKAIAQGRYDLLYAKKELKVMKNNYSQTIADANKVGCTEREIDDAVYKGIEDFYKQFPREKHN